MLITRIATNWLSKPLIIKPTTFKFQFVQPNKFLWTTKPTFTSTAFKRTYATHNQLSYKLKQQRNSNSINSLLKPTLFTLAFSAGTLIITPYLFEYTPLSYFKRNPIHLLYAIIGINIAVCGAWYLRYNNARLNNILNDYFLLNRSPIRKSQWCLIWSFFSHQEPLHLLFNMLCFYSFGTTIINMIGSVQFTELYLISGCVSSLFSLIFSFITKSYGFSLGASGAISSIFATFAYLFPKASVMVFFFPIPGGAQVALLGFTVYNIAGIVMKWGSFDFAAHLGGTAVGIAYGAWLKSRINKQRRSIYL